MRVISLGSGSKGNCTLITNGRNHLLIDAGLSIRVILAKLAEIGLNAGEIDALLVTHEHNDHIRSLPEIASVLPVYSHEDTLEAAGAGVTISYKQCVDIEEKPFSIGTFDILPFAINHDAAHPFGYVIKDENDSVCYFTDTGFVSKGALDVCRGCKKAVIESNHDKELLLRGVYPEYLKKRILSDKGHLCNEESALTAADLIASGAQKIMLAHLSENNNLSELAYWTTRRYLDSVGIGYGDVSVKVASQRDTVEL